jgi:hypothetical protein
MPGALKKPRWDGLRQGRYSRYILYGLGEVFLIFIGITLAVALENSAEQRREAALTAGLLSGVAQDLEANIIDLRRNLSSDSLYIASIDRVVAHLESSEEWNDSIGSVLRTALRWSSPYLSTAGYQGLKQAGLHRVPDADVRRRIINLFENSYGLLVGDVDRAMWTYVEAVVMPLVHTELVRSDSGSDGNAGFRPKSLTATRARDDLRSAFLEQRDLIIGGAVVREAALEETEGLLSTIDSLASR